MQSEQVSDLVDAKASLLVPLRGRSTGSGASANGIYTPVTSYAKRASINVAGLGGQGLRATAATNALEHEADIAKVQGGLGHANQYHPSLRPPASTTRRLSNV